MAPTPSTAAKVVATLAEELFELGAGVLDVEDVERPHDMRSATRRATACRLPGRGRARVATALVWETMESAPRVVSSRGVSPYEEPGGSATAAVAGHADLDQSALYFNRELSWVDFNDRVLQLVEDPSIPLLEHVKFAARPPVPLG